MTRPQVEAEIAHIQTSGQSVSKVSVGRILGTTNGSEIQRALGRRFAATPKEYRELIANLRARLADHRHCSSSREIIARNVSAVLLAILTHRPLVEIVCFNHAAAAAQMKALRLAEVEDDTDDEGMLLIRESLSLYAGSTRNRKWKRPKRENQPWLFDSFRGEA